MSNDKSTKSRIEQSQSAIEKSEKIISENTGYLDEAFPPGTPERDELDRVYAILLETKGDATKLASDNTDVSKKFKSMLSFEIKKYGGYLKLKHIIALSQKRIDSERTEIASEVDKQANEERKTKINDTIEALKAEKRAAWLYDDSKLADGPRKQLTHGKKRAHVYALVVYPDAMPEAYRTDNKWIQVLTEYHHKLIVSPYHDKDVNEDGSTKLAHYHVLLLGGNQWLSLQQLRDAVLYYFDGHGVAIPQRVGSVDGAIRYMTHIDNPEKHQYNKDDIQCFGGADITKAYKRSESDKTETLVEILDYVRNDEKIQNYNQLLDKAMDLRKDGNADWFDTLVSQSWMIERYISSRRNAKKDDEREKQRITNLNAMAELKNGYADMKQTLEVFSNTLTVFVQEMEDIKRDSK